MAHRLFHAAALLGLLSFIGCRNLVGVDPTDAAFQPVHACYMSAGAEPVDTVYCRP